MKKLMLAAVSAVLLIGAGIAGAETLETVTFPDGAKVRMESIVQYANPDNAFGCSLGQTGIDCSGDVIGYAITSSHTNTGYQTSDTVRVYTDGHRYYEHSVYTYKEDCIFGLPCYELASWEYSADGINWEQGY